MKRLKKAYCLLFFKLYQFFKSLPEKSFEEWKAGLVIQTLQLFVLGIIWIQITIITKNDIIPNTNPKIWIIPLALIIAILNYHVFLGKKIWKNYEMEFKSYSKKKNRVINFIVLCIVFGVFALLILSYYQLSQIDWSKYR